MHERVGYPVGVPCWVELRTPDPDAAAAFYGGLFDWTFIPRAAGYRLGCRRRRTVAGIAPADDGPATWFAYVRVDGAAATAERVREAGGRAGEPVDLAGLARSVDCSGPAGEAFGLYEPRDLAGAEHVNAPGTWNFSSLETPDVTGAIAFYGFLFGWQLDRLEFAGTVSYLVRLPGYGDFLAEHDPSIRERHASSGAPPGFSDAVGWASPAPEAETATWSMTFAAAGTDAVAKRARELGATVVVPPFDAGPTRVAILRDPQGASFSVSTYTPAEA